MVASTAALPAAPTFKAYKAAADRIRRGLERPGDEELCDAWDRECNGGAVRITNVMDLPMARGMFNADRKAVR